MDETCRTRLSEAAADLFGARDAALPGRWLDPADWHVTLCFLGAVPERLLAPLHAQAAQIEAPAFALQFQRAEYWREARVIAALAPAPATALQLASALRERARGLGLEPDDKPLRPHVTLARGVSLPPRQQVAGHEAHGELRVNMSLQNISLQATEFHLAESRTRPAAARYTSLARWPLRA